MQSDKIEECKWSYKRAECCSFSLCIRHINYDLVQGKESAEYIPNQQNHLDAEVAH